jgi:hypothetical protein
MIRRACLHAHQNHSLLEAPVAPDIQKLPTYPCVGNSASVTALRLQTSQIETGRQQEIKISLKTWIYRQAMKKSRRFSQNFLIRLYFEHACCFITHRSARHLAENRIRALNVHRVVFKKTGASCATLDATLSVATVTIPQG